MLQISSKIVLFIIVFITMTSLFEGVTIPMKESKIELPINVGVWTRADSPQLIDSKNIFEYMDGAGELYLAYRFGHLDVYEYRADDQNNIVVELYFMKTSDDAFGLLSLDWGGEPVNLSGSNQGETTETRMPSSRALYGEGLLRVWSDDIYGRVMANRETPAAKDAVLTLGRIIVANRRNPPQPALLSFIPLNVGPDWKLRKDRMVYFRSYLVLNSFYYLSQQNILNLDHSTEAASVPYENATGIEGGKRIQFLLVKYLTRELAQAAFGHFLRAYLPEHGQEVRSGLKTGSSGSVKIEDGWLGYKLSGQYLGLVFECSDRDTSQKIINGIEFK
jgi:hypothetical protein